MMYPLNVLIRMGFQRVIDHPGQAPAFLIALVVCHT
jgi:hypothetical protein